MRIIQLGFQLHAPYELREMSKPAETEANSEPEKVEAEKVKQVAGTEKAATEYFDSEKSFQKADQEIYQPFFALLERNTQKYKGLHFSLMISGAWLELAEKYDAELIERLRKLVRLERVELVSVPYYYSLAFFYAPDELAEQVRRYQDQLERLFGVTGRIFALPELIYNDAIGKWAEEFGFAGMLVGGSARALDWRSPNHVYEAAGCEYLRLLVRNSWLSEAVEKGDEKLLVEKKTDEGETKRVLSVEKFRKLLDLDFLRGSLVNLYFDAGMFARLREKGVAKFFDELIATWLNEENNKFATAAEACIVETPTAELTIKETVSWRGDAEKDAGRAQGVGLVLKSEIENKLPKWLEREEQRAVSELIYGARRQILASEDEKLAADLRRLMLIDYHKAGMAEKVGAVVDDLERRAEEIKKTQAVEISRAYTKKRDRGDIERKAEPTESDSGAVKVVLGGGAVKVNFSKRTGTMSGAVHGVVGARRAEDGSEEVLVRRLGKTSELDETHDVEDEAIEIDDTVEVVRELNEEVEEVEAVGASDTKSIKEPKAKKHAVRKIIKKLVIE